MVLVSHSREFVFLKTHKTASTSFEMLLEPWCAPSGRVVTEAADELISEYGLVGARLIQAEEKPHFRNHVGARKVAEFLGAERWNRYCKLTSVRNPFARAVSQFYYGLVSKGLPVPQTLDDNRAQFREFIFRPTHKSDVSMTHLKGKYIIDDAIRIEHIDVDLARIGLKLGISLSRANLPHVKDNASAKPPIDFYALFERDIKEEVRKRQFWVFERFGYSRKLRDARL